MCKDSDIRIKTFKSLKDLEELLFMSEKFWFKIHEIQFLS